MLLELADRIASEEFARQARHPTHPSAFTRLRKLPLPALIAGLLSMRGASQQSSLDAFYGALTGDAGFVRGVSDRAFAKARSHLHLPALAGLNDWLVRRADSSGLVPRWHGLRVVAGDASVLRPAMRACHRTRGLMAADQRLFALFLLGAELTLHARVHSAAESERAMLVEALSQLGPDDVLVLDRGYPAAWLINLLLDRGIRFVMRYDNDSTWAAVKAFMRGQLPEQVVTLRPPSARDARDWQCPPTPPTVRLVRQIAPSGQARVLLTNVGADLAPAAAFGDLYHQRWRIEEAFKRLKHRLHLEAVTGLSQHALLIDVAAKVLADNLTSLLCAAAGAAADLAARSRRCNRAYAARLAPGLLAPVLLGIGDALGRISDALHLLACTSQRFVARRSRPRPAHHSKPHPSQAYRP